MRKTVVALCLEEKEYRERFENCWIYHYKNQYDLYLCSELKDLLETNEKIYEVIITDINRAMDLKKLKKRGKEIVVLWEKDSDIAESKKLDGVTFTEKYQEIYKIAEKVKELIKKGEEFQSTEGSHLQNYKTVGIFSLDCEGMQMPFAALTACEYGEKLNTLLINLQEYSGFEANRENENLNFLGIEELMTMSIMDDYSKKRLYDAIGHEQNWDYIYPARNTELLSEGNAKLYQSIIEAMVEEFGYQMIIINFGIVFSGMNSMFECCDEFYLLVSKKENMSWREREFQKELERKEKKAFSQQIKRVEIPTIYWGDSRDWKSLVQQWRWSGIGDRVRKYIWAGL